MKLKHQPAKYRKETKVPNLLCVDTLGSSRFVVCYIFGWWHVVMSRSVFWMTIFHTRWSNFPPRYSIETPGSTRERHSKWERRGGGWDSEKRSWTVSIIVLDFAVLPRSLGNLEFLVACDRNSLELTLRLQLAPISWTKGAEKGGILWNGILWNPNVHTLMRRKFNKWTTNR